MVIKRALQTNDNNTTWSKKANADSIQIFFNLNYSGETAERMVKPCIKKLYKSFKKEINVKLATHYKTTKMPLFTNTKDKTCTLNQSSVVYKFTCPGCSSNCISKTGRLCMKERKNMDTLKRRVTNKVQFMNICQLGPIIVI